MGEEREYSLGMPPVRVPGEGCTLSLLLLVCDASHLFLFLPGTDSVIYLKHEIYTHHLTSARTLIAFGSSYIHQRR